MRSIMVLIGAEFALEFAKIAESDCLHSSIYKCKPMGAKHGHYIFMTMSSWMSSIMGQIGQ